ncbi:MAG: c-type cytochrome [Parvibaculum sp.]|nr:c-type cytochrome [Parvibaculum sp.]
MSGRTIGLAIAGAFAAIIVAALGTVFLVFPRVSPAPDIKVELTPERVARGNYLFNNALACVGCHTPELEPHRFSGIPDNTRIAAGRYMGGPEKGLPAEMNVPNLTPTALGTWSDGEIYRAITAGVDRDGRAMFAFMPYVFYSRLDPEDVTALVAYLRSLPPQPVTLPPLDAPLPIKIAMRFVAADAKPQKRPDASDEVALGHYLAYASACFECHTLRNARGEPVGVPFAGGNVFGLAAGGLARSANITPDKQAGIGAWTRADFIARFRARNEAELSKLMPVAGEMDTEMPWTAYAGMTDADLGAIYAYLQTVPADGSEIVTYEAPQ